MKNSLSSKTDLKFAQCDAVVGRFKAKVLQPSMLQGRMFVVIETWSILRIYDRVLSINTRDLFQSNCWHTLKQRDQFQ